MSVSISGLCLSLNDMTETFLKHVVAKKLPFQISYMKNISSQSFKNIEKNNDISFAPGDLSWNESLDKLNFTPVGYNAFIKRIYGKVICIL